MTTRERVIQVIECMPEDLVREVQHYAEYLHARSQNEEWSRIALMHLATHYLEEEVEYSTDDLRQ